MYDRNVIANVKQNARMLISKSSLHFFIVPPLNGRTLSQVKNEIYWKKKLANFILFVIRILSNQRLYFFLSSITTSSVTKRLSTANYYKVDALDLRIGCNKGQKISHPKRGWSLFFQFIRMVDSYETLCHL